MLEFLEKSLMFYFQSTSNSRAYDKQSDLTPTNILLAHNITRNKSLSEEWTKEAGNLMPGKFHLRRIPADWYQNI